MIPTEVEKFGNIAAGKNQLLEYQRIWNKKYGLLTDGYEWQFYNNNLLVKTFTLDKIFDNIHEFLEFWNEYIQPRNYYLQFFEKAGQLRLLEEDISVGNRIEDFFKDITTLIESFKNKLNIRGYFEKVGKNESKKLATEITYAYIIQFILYKTLVDNDFEQYRDDFNIRLQRIYNDLRVETYSDALTAIKAIGDMVSLNVYKPFKEEQEFINRKLEGIRLKPSNDLSDIAPWLDIFIFIKRYDFVNVKNEIFGYVYENYLKELYEEEKKMGQYFTDPIVVNFMLRQIGYTSELIKGKINAGELDKLSLVDPACGSGTFLYSATSEIIKSFSTITRKTSKQIEDIVTNNIFGLDVEEFPLYLAEISILMRMLPLIMGEKFNNPLEKKIKVFYTEDSIAEFIGSGLASLGKQISFPNNIIQPKFDSFMRDKQDLLEMKGSMTSFPRRRFDYVIGNPPYIGYNECCKKKIKFTQLIKNKTIQMSDIFGANLNTVPGRIKAYAPKPNFYAFFIALGLALLKKEAKICYIVPQTLLTSSDHDVIRYHLAKYSTIAKVFTFTGDLFIGRGIKQNKAVPTSSLIFIAERKMPSREHEVEIINYRGKDENVATIFHNISVNKGVDRLNIRQDKLLDDVANWNFITWDKITSDFMKEYGGNELVDIYRLPELSMPAFGDTFYFDKGLVFPKNAIKRLDKSQHTHAFYYLPFAYQDRIRLGITDNVILEKNIRFPKGSQGIDVYEKKYKVIWRYMNPTQYHFSQDRIMVNFNWIVISSDNKREIEYILSLLNSKCNRFVFNALLWSKSEKDLLIGIKAIKEFMRVPKITANNQHIKNEIIKITEKILELEEKTLSDYLDFSGILVQKFDDVKVEGTTLVLCYGNQKIKLPIKEDSKLIDTAIVSTHGISLSELRNRPVIDIGKCAKLKDYIDDLVFALYFNIPIDNLSIDQATHIHKLCSKSSYYNLLV